MPFPIVYEQSGTHVNHLRVGPQMYNGDESTFRWIIFIIWNLIWKFTYET